jgi:predicted permease
VGVAGLHDRVRERIAAIPGVRGASYAWMPLLTRAGAGSRIEIPGRVASSGAPPAAMVNAVSPDFFATLEVPLRRGRAFTARDDAAAPKVAIINETLARKYFDGEDPIGRRCLYRAAPGPMSEVEIVGVVRDTRYNDVRGQMPATLFVPFAQNSWGEASYLVRTAGNPEALIGPLRAAVQSVAPNLPLADVRTQEAQVGKLLSSERIFARFSIFFGGLALTLVCVGLFGLMSYVVTRRTGEIGVRVALGATPARVQWMVLRESLALVSMGAVVGLTGAAFATKAVEKMLYGVPHVDVATYGMVTLLLAGAAGLAAWWPARRAAKIDPVVALRAE